MKRFFDFHFEKEIKLLPLSLNQSLRAVGVSLLYLFSIIYVYKILFGLTGQEKIALLGVFAYLLGVHLFKLIANFLAEEWSLKKGLKNPIYLGLFFLVLCITALVFSSGWPLLLIAASPLWGLSIGFYWFGWHGMMVKTGRGGAFGKELGIIKAISTIFLLGTPFLGGVLINFAGYRALFLVALLFIILAGFTLGSLRRERTHYDTSLREISNLFKTHKKMTLAYMGNAAAGTIYGAVLPLYLFLILKKELSLGEFFSLSMVLVALVNLLIGRWTDIKGKGGLIVYGSVFQFLVWVGRTLTQSISVLFTFDVIDRVTRGMIGIPLDVLSYEKALDGRSTGRAVLFREVAITFGSILVDSLLIVTILLGMGLKFAFFLAAIFSLSPLLIVKKR